MKQRLAPDCGAAVAQVEKTHDFVNLFQRTVKVLTRVTRANAESSAGEKQWRRWKAYNDCRNLTKMRGGWGVEPTSVKNPVRK